MSILIGQSVLQSTQLTTELTLQTLSVIKNLQVDSFTQHCLIVALIEVLLN